MDKNCCHALLEIGTKYLPYRYLCLKCRKRLKIASGIHIPSPGSLELTLNILGGREVTAEQIKEKIGAMMDKYRRAGEDSRTPMPFLDKRIALQVVLDWIENEEGERRVKL